MCKFFSFVTEPENHGGQRFYFDWEYRKAHLADDNHDSHSVICRVHGLDEDKCNKYEYNPFPGVFTEDGIHSPVNDRVQAEEWVRTLDFKRVVEPLIVKPIFNPLSTTADVTSEHIALLKKWASVRASVWESVWASVRASVRASVGDSVGDSVWASVRASVGDSVWESVWDSVWASVWDSVRASVWESVGAYIGSFFDIPYKRDITPSNRLWESGLVASFDGKTWRLHTGPKAAIVYEISADDLRKWEA